MKDISDITIRPMHKQTTEMKVSLKTQKIIQIKIKVLKWN